MEHGAVRRPPAAETVTLHDPLEPLAAADPHDVDPVAVTPALRQALWQLDATIPLELTTMDAVISESGAIAQSVLVPF